MSAKKIGSVDAPQAQVSVGSRQASLDLFADAISVHKNGIEFRSPSPFTEWTEMTVAISAPRDGAKFHCSGVVIACSGNKHTGYRVSMVFTSLSKHAQTRLNSMAHSDLGAG